MVMATVLAVPMITTIASLQAQRVVVVHKRVYDRDHKDYHVWDDREDRSYRVYTTEQHRTYRVYTRLKHPEKRLYWKWRHEHPDKD